MDTLPCGSSGSQGGALSIAEVKFLVLNKILIQKSRPDVYNRDEDTPWPEICNLLAAIVGRILRSPLLIRRSFRNAVIRPPSAASLAVRPRRANKVGEAPVIVRHHPMAHL
jgi:hypothetical protein